jgi:predicted transcriptional regulator
MKTELQSVYVADLMHRRPLTVGVKDQLSDVAKRFQHHQINSAPVVDEEGVCVGFISSIDLVRFEAMRKLLEDHWQRGDRFDVARYDNEAQVDELRFDQVGSQMTKQFRSIAAGMSLVDAISVMCQEHLHHLLILDDSGKPYGILSTMDILQFLIERPAEAS